MIYENYWNPRNFPRSYSRLHLFRFFTPLYLSATYNNRTECADRRQCECRIPATIPVRSLTSKSRDNSKKFCLLVSSFALVFHDVSRPRASTSWRTFLCTYMGSYILLLSPWPEVDGGNGWPLVHWRRCGGTSSTKKAPWIVQPLLSLGPRGEARTF